MPPFCLCQKFANSGPNSSIGLTPWHQNTKALSSDEHCLISPGHSAVLASNQSSLPCQQPVIPTTFHVISTKPFLSSCPSSAWRDLAARLVCVYCLHGQVRHADFSTPTLVSARSHRRHSRLKCQGPCYLVLCYFSLFCFSIFLYHSVLL